MVFESMIQWTALRSKRTDHFLRVNFSTVLTLSLALVIQARSRRFLFLTGHEKCWRVRSRACLENGEQRQGREQNGQQVREVHRCEATKPGGLTRSSRLDRGERT